MRKTLKNIPAERVRALSSGLIETGHLLEWLSVDMQVLLEVVRHQLDIREEVPPIISGNQFNELGVTRRLKAIGSYLRSAGCLVGRKRFERLAQHGSDVVRQWAAYILMASPEITLADRLQSTHRFAGDSNMSVREVAWMTFRPYLADNLDEGLRLLEPMACHSNAYLRRFAIEVSRPRSVWGQHLPSLKRNPEPGRPLLEEVRGDSTKYVQDAVGNWLNDASKTAPLWVISVTDEWLDRDPSPETRRIVRRGRRTLGRES